MKSNLDTLGGVFAFFAVAVSVSSAQAAVLSPWISPVYGTDDRKDLYAVKDPQLRQMADSSVALIRNDRISPVASELGYSLKTKTLRDRDVCSTERFVDQPTLAFCSGALVGSDLVLTAGHCVKTIDDCKSTLVAFGFALKTPTAVMDHLPAQEVYSCSEIVGRSFEDGGGDYAVIRLDRPVEGHAPLKIERKEALQNGTPLVVIGHPSGLVQKIANNAVVRDASDPYRFVSNLDTYAGNSGSPVFNARTGLIVGILVSGDKDYQFDVLKQCKVDYRCTSDGCRGEKSTFVSHAAPYIPE